jgi:aminoglycoside phosphotransferase (APT) family kinase protein
VENLIRKICAAEGLTCRDIQALSGGQVNRVFRIDNDCIVRIGMREDAVERLKSETELLQNLAGKIPVPRILAFGQQDGFVYQVQEYLPGQKLYAVWNHLQPDVQDTLMAELAAHLKALHAMTFPSFGSAQEDARAYPAWSDYLADKLARIVAELQALKILMVPGFLEMALDYFEEHRQALEGGSPVLVHGDLSMVNILVEHGRVSAVLDFEYSLRAPRDYELAVMEAFCLYPNDWVEEDHAAACTADFSGFFPLLQKHYPELFETRNLRERVNLYQLVSTLSSYLAWRKDNLAAIPPDRMAARGFYMARITNFIHANGTRMF